MDAISGGTLTSNGVKAMLFTCLGDYEPFFRSVQTKADRSIVPVADTIATDTLATDSLTTVPTDTLTKGGAK